MGGQVPRGDIAARGISLDRLGRILATAGLGWPKTVWGPRSGPSPDGAQRRLIKCGLRTAGVLDLGPSH